MGRKKRKVATVGGESSETPGIPHSDVLPPPPPPPLARVDPRMHRIQRHQEQQQQQQEPEAEAATKEAPESPKKMSSGYATTSHSAEIIDEDIYVSDGSESDEDLMADRLETMPSQDEEASEENNIKTNNIAGRSIEMVLSGSKMGLMRRGIHRPQVLVQPNRQWARQTPQQQQDQQEPQGTNEQDTEMDEEKRKQQQEEELAKLDPAQRAAKLLAEKQRKLEDAKILARRLESEENAGRDPCLFSKRTSFDIRFDQIDDKPWLRGAGDVTDFFNYGFSEEDWSEYAEQQLLIRHELVDASRQKRAPDPSIVPVVPKKPKKQNPRVAVATEVKDEDNKSEEGNQEDEDSSAVIGPVLKKAKADPSAAIQGPTKNNDERSNNLPDVQVGAGGAWGMGAAPGSVLAKLIEEQEKQQQQQQQHRSNHNDHNNRHESMHEDSSPRKQRGNEYHNNKYENNSAPSYYGSGGDNNNNNHGGYNNNHDNSNDPQQNDHSYGGGWNNKHGNKNNSQQNDHNDNRNYRYHDNNNNNNNNNNGDWNNRNNNDRWNHNNNHNNGHRGGNRGRRNGGDYGEKGRNRGGNNYGDRGGHHQRRKRPRDDYDDRYSRR